MRLVEPQRVAVREGHPVGQLHHPLRGFRGQRDELWGADAQLGRRLVGARGGLLQQGRGGQRAVQVRGVQGVRGRGGGRLGGGGEGLDGVFCERGEVGGRGEDEGADGAVEGQVGRVVVDGHVGLGVVDWDEKGR